MVTLIEAVLSNATVAAVLAIALGGLGLALRKRSPETGDWIPTRPALMNRLWLLALLTLLAPPLYHIRVHGFAKPWQRPGIRNQSVGQLPLEAPLTQVSDAEGDATPTQFGLTLPPLEHFAVGAWLLIAAGWIATALRRLSRYRDLVCRTAVRAPPEAEAIARELAQSMGLSRCPTILFAPVSFPEVVPGRGWNFLRNPVVVIPESLWSAWSSQKRAAALAHELAHVLRGDHWARIVELLALALYWWHPALWWARSNLRRTEEQCCDAWVVWTLPDSRGDYARVLAEAADYSSTLAASPIAAIALRGSSLRSRVAMILGEAPKPRMSRCGLTALALLGGCIVFVRPTLGEHARMLLRDQFDSDSASEAMWLPAPEFIAQSGSIVENSVLTLRNRAYLVSRDEFAGPISVSLDWLWRPHFRDPRYSDVLTVAVRTSGSASRTHPHEALDGLIVKLNAWSQQAQIALITGTDENGKPILTNIAESPAGGLPMPANMWFALRIEADDRTIRVYQRLRDAPGGANEHAILEAEYDERFGWHRIAIYNRELVGCHHEALVDNIKVRELQRGRLSQ